MRQIWFKTLLGVLALAGLGFGAFLAPVQVEAYQSAETPPGVFITVENPPDGVNVRAGPSTVDYGSPIGHLNPGDTAPALGKSAEGLWVQISYLGGTGWVYAAYVSVSGGELQVVPAPPTPAPLMTATIDPTLAAAFNIQPTQTRIPTFTPPPPLQVPQFTEESPGRSGGPFGILITGLGLLGGLGLFLSYVLRK